METIAFVVLLILGILTLLWIYVGPWAVFLLIALVVFLAYKFLKPNYQKDADSDYVRKAFQFIEFYNALPRKGIIFITPQKIGVEIPDECLGSAISTYWNVGGVEQQWLEDKLLKYIGGETNLARFRKLGLQAELHDDSMDHPVLSMYSLCCYSDRDREKYIKAIEWKYKNKYGKDLKIYHLNNY